MTDLKEMRKAYEAAEARGDEVEAERLWNLFCDARANQNVADQRQIANATITQSPNWRD
jgi:hypothetical protein